MERRRKLKSPPNEKVAGTDKAPTTPKHETRPKDTSSLAKSKQEPLDIESALPHALGAEKAVLSVMLREPDEYADQPQLTADHFYQPAHGTILAAMRQLAANGKPIELTTFIQHLTDTGQIDDIGGPPTLSELMCYAPTARHFNHHMAELNDKLCQRLFILAGHAAANLDEAEHDRLIAERLAVMQANGGGGKFQFVHMDELHAGQGAFDFVEDVLTDGAASVIYGASNCGKTFFALDLAAHVATGTEWQGKEVEQGAVLYVALEGKQGAVNRVEAMRRRGILPEGSPFFLCFAPVDLLDPAHPGEIVRLIKSVTAQAAFAVRLVVIDTLARAMAGGDENAGKDMGEAVKTIDAVRAATGAHLCIIHHCGKDAVRGARGHSSLRAAIDTEIEVTHPEGDKYRVATIVKQRDLPTIAAICFSLDVVEVGTNRRGKPITSCVVKAEDEIMLPAKKKPGAKPRYTFEMILDLLPQPTIKAWQAAAKDAHNMGKEGFDDYKSRCSSQWEKTKQGGIVKTLELLPSIENRGNGGNSF